MHQVLGARAQLIRGASQMKARHAAAVFVRALRRRPGERDETTRTGNIDRVELGPEADQTRLYKSPPMTRV